jgi:hypothetical protein
MSSIVAALAALKARLETVPGVVTVLDVVPEQDPPDGDLPLICLKVNAPGSTGTMDRRTLLWPVDLYFFGCVRSRNIADDLALVLPFLERIVGAIDADITLGHTLDGVVTYPEPMGVDPGAIAWVKQTYTGFVLKPILPVITDTPYG